LNDFNERTKPQEVKLLRNKNVGKIAVGPTFTVALGRSENAQIEEQVV
jgi:hypothetical protein